jgi:serine/threonine protein kinase
VAIKVLSSRLSRNGNALRALQQEAAKGRYLSHRNIVRFIDLDRDDDLYFIVMEWLEGRTLADILDDKLAEKMELGTALDIVKQIARALDYAHRRGVVHADVKPGNIMVTPTGLVKLYDFGVARVRQTEHEGKSKFDPGVMEASTPAYSSMQVLTGEVPVPADDVFSLGCLMYRLVADHRVFGPRNAADAAAEGMEPQQPQGLSQVQWRALKKALSYSRVTRFDSPADFIKALEPTAKHEPLADETIVADYDDAPRRSPWRFAVPAVIILASIVVIMQPDLRGFVDEPRPKKLHRNR